MDDWQTLRWLLPPELNARARRRRDGQVRLRIDGKETSFRLVRRSWLLEGEVEQIATGDMQSLVVYQRASSKAREALRAAGISYAGADGRVYLRAPGLLIERDDRVRPGTAAPGAARLGDAELRNPFSGKASRVSRWLLLHPGMTVAQSELARQLDLSPALVSRTVRALERQGFVTPASSPSRLRRTVKVHRPRAFIDEWATRYARRSIPQLVWDVGARDAESVLELLEETAAERSREGWAIGGLAGAAEVRPAVVEPRDVLVWVTAEGRDLLQEELRPRAGRRGRGALRVAVDRDPWPLTHLASTEARIPVVDRVQLYLDCTREGERAYEAADAIAREAGW
jgi:hypothetical protein